MIGMRQLLRIVAIVETVRNSSDLRGGEISLIFKLVIQPALMM